MPTRCQAQGGLVSGLCCALRFGPTRTGGIRRVAEFGGRGQALGWSRHCWSWGITFSHTCNHHLDGLPGWTLILVLPVWAEDNLAWPGCPMEASFPLPAILAVFYLISFKLFSTLFPQLLVGLFVSLGVLLDVPTSLCSPQGFQDASKVLRDVSGQAEPTPRQQHFPRPCLEPGTSANASGPSTTFSDKAQSTTPPFCVILLSFAGAVTRSIFSHHGMKPSPKPWGGCVSVCGDQSILAA